MTQEQPQPDRASDGFAILTLATTFLLRYGPFLVSRLLFEPFLDTVHIYAPHILRGLTASIDRRRSVLSTRHWDRLSSVRESAFFDSISFLFLCVGQLWRTADIPLHFNLPDAIPSVRFLL